MSENITPSPDPNENSMQRLRRFVARHRKWLTGLGFVALLLLVVLYIREFISGTIFTRYAIIACIFLVLAFLLDEDEGGVSERPTPAKRRRRRSTGGMSCADWG